MVKPYCETCSKHNSECNCRPKPLVQMLHDKDLWRFWCCFWISVGTLGGLGIGVIGGNIIEAWMHDVSLYDATFIESWKLTSEAEQ